jgi:hypothetical protein
MPHYTICEIIDEVQKRGATQFCMAYFTQFNKRHLFMLYFFNGKGLEIGYIPITVSRCVFYHNRPLKWHRYIAQLHDFHPLEKLYESLESV